MQKPEIWKLVLSRIFPAKADLSPNDWRSFVYRNLVVEVEKEVLRFYGTNDCIESQNPGLDYTRPDHRLRLACFPRHRQLFRVFDKLRLTNTEIDALCTWRGTKYDKEAFENQHKFSIRNTTWDDVQAYQVGRAIAVLQTATGPRLVDVDTGEVADHEMESGNRDEERVCSLDEMDDNDDEESEDDLQQSVGLELNQRLLAATEARARGEDATLDADWEQWMKEAVEGGRLPDIPASIRSFSGPSEMASYLGREIPEAYRHTIETQATILPGILPPSSPYFQ